MSETEMAKSRQTSDVTPFEAEPEFAPVTAPPAEPDPRDAEIARLRAELTAVAERGDDFDHPLKGDPALRDVKVAADEIARLRAENEALRAGPGAALVTGGRFTVSLQDGPKVTVECNAGEHPYEAFKRVSGVINSVHAPEIHRAADDAPLGHHRPDGTVKPFAP